MKSLSETCTLICKNKREYQLSDTENLGIAKTLASLLIDNNDVNTTWSVESVLSCKQQCGIVFYLKYIDDKLRAQLLKRGLDLNQVIDNGVAPFTWLIGNAQNKLVDELLTSAEQNQTLEQRLVWINKTDKMVRDPDPIESIITGFCCGVFSKVNYEALTRVEQTALQLAIAKGYRDKSFGDKIADLDVSNLKIAEKLLKLGAAHEINYQEPTRGNTALHIAYARRDLDAVRLLESYGASHHIRNKYGELPADMLKLSFGQVEKLMRFHTSPDGHPNTFRLNQEEFNEPHNFQEIKKTIKYERQYIEVKGKECFLPENTFSFGPIESAAIQNGSVIASLLTTDDISIEAAITSIKHRINLLQFIREDASLHLQNLIWQDYENERQKIDDKYHGSTNPFMYNINQAEYQTFQNYVNANNEEAKTLIEKNIHDCSLHIKKFEAGLGFLEKFMLAKSAKNHKKVLIKKILADFAQQFFQNPTTSKEKIERDNQPNNPKKLN